MTGVQTCALPISSTSLSSGWTVTSQTGVQTAWSILTANSLSTPNHLEARPNIGGTVSDTVIERTISTIGKQNINFKHKRKWKCHI